MDAFRKKQEEMRRLREEADAKEAAAASSAGAGSAAASPAAAASAEAAPSSAADRFRSLRRDRSGGVPGSAAASAATTTAAASGSLSASGAAAAALVNGGSVAPSTSSTSTTATTSAGDSSKAAASYFLNKKDRSGSTPMEPLMLNDSECTPDQYRAMYERAVKDNQLLVKKYNERAAECKKLKKELEQKTHAHAPDSSSRVSRVVSRDQRMSMAMSTQLGGQLGNLLTLVQNLDEQIKASEAARQYAEEKLIEMALQKIDVTEALKKVDDALEKVAARMRGGGNVDKERVAEIITTIRRDVLGAQVDEPAPAAAAAAAEPAAAKAAPRGGLLSQIRAGVQLSRVDVEKLKEARRKERIRTARESGVMMQSLEQTLRSALEMRQFELNPDDPNTVGGEDWD
jgi:hypothetical protein